MNSTDDAVQSIVDELIDSCFMDEILEIHRSIKLEYSHLLLPDAKDLVNGDIESTKQNSFTKSESKSSTVFVNCGRCATKVAATRFAPHLSNCMGLGRNSSRRANRLVQIR